MEYKQLMAQDCNHIRTEQKPSFNGKDHLLVRSAITMEKTQCLRQLCKSLANKPPIIGRLAVTRFYK